MRSDGLFGFRLIYNNTYIKEFKPPFKHLRTCKDKCTGVGGGGGGALQSGHRAWWSADNCSIFRSKKRTGRGNQKCLKNLKKIIAVDNDPLPGRDNLMLIKNYWRKCQIHRKQVYSDSFINMSLQLYNHK